MAALGEALAVALPGVEVQGIRDHVEGYANDRWTVDSDIGRLLVKVGRQGNEPPVHVEGQRRAQRWLTESGFPTPELLALVDRSVPFDGRPLSVQRFIEGEASSDVVEEIMTVDERQRFFGDFGETVGRLHSIDIPGFGGWTDDDGRPRPSWIEAIRPSEAMAILRASATIPRVLLDEAEVRIESGLDAVPDDLVPRLVHCDLHLDNTMVSRRAFAAVIDFELVREWDPVWDFATRLDGVFGYFHGSDAPFMAAYRSVTGDLPASFGLRRWLYCGIYAVLCNVEWLEGNQAHADSPERLRSWLAGPVPI